MPRCVLALIFPVLLLGCDGNDYKPVDAPLGKGSMTFTTAAGANLTIYYYIPARAAADSPVVITLHGEGRDADVMRDDWTSKADTYGCMVFAPRFDSTQFPNDDGYILGNVFEDGDHPSAATLNPEAEWSFSVIEPLFDKIVDFTGASASAYDIFGHSAGAQFVHRFVELVSDARIHRAVAANAGWYTMPDTSVTYPYGLGETPVTGTGYFEQKLVILAGDKDTDPNSADLRHNAQTDAQGANRFERSAYFFTQAQAKAASLGVDFAWSRTVVPGVGHSDAQMAEAAADYLYKR